MAGSSARRRDLRRHLLDGQVIPAHPLALTAHLTLDEKRQRALTRYYIDAGAGGLAVGVHTTQFSIRDAGVDLYRPVLELAMDEVESAPLDGPFAMIAGAIGRTAQAVAEAQVAAALGYDAVLLSLGAWRDDANEAILEHCRAVGEVLPLFGFYLQPSVGGRVLDHHFWRELAELPELWAVKIAPFNRYQTLDVVRAIVEAGRDDVALYTGNDDSIVADLVTPFDIVTGGRVVRRHIVGGLLGQWAVWTPAAVRLLALARGARATGLVPADLLALGAALTDANGAIFDAANGFAGCISGIHEVLRHEGLLEGIWCLDPREQLSAGQAEEIERVLRSYPQLRN